MSKPLPELDLQAVEALAKSQKVSLSLHEFYDGLKGEIPRRTLQRYLKQLVETGRLRTEGKGRWQKYFAAPSSLEESKTLDVIPSIHLSREAHEIQKYVLQPLHMRKAVGYNSDFLNSYRPNETEYLSEKDRTHLKNLGTVGASKQPAGTYARMILDRLLIDLSWNSSRLEGNTYSLLDTKRLIAFGKMAEGKDRLEAQMILNHKDAIEFLVESAQEIGVNRYTMLNLHALLANNLLSDPMAEGRLRKIPVGIGGSVFHPLEVPQLIEEYFLQILDTTNAIQDPFEQSFFLMVHLPYLQPFDDVNKRVSRLAANIPLIKQNLIPLAFLDLPADLYLQAVLGVYELNRIDLLKHVFMWAYERSAERYAVVRQSLGEPDPFRLKHREELREVIGEIVRNKLGRKSASTHINHWAEEKISEDDRNQFIETAEIEILGLHEGNFARYRIRPSEFEAWLQSW